jgi:carbonic anhydrase
MPYELIDRLRHFHDSYFPRFEGRYRELVRGGQHPSILFIGCSDSRIVPYMLTDSGPGELFVSRNVGGFVPPYDGSLGFHGTGAAIEFAVLTLGVHDIIVCGHTHCGAIRALYDDPHPAARHMTHWLELARGATLPVARPSEEALRRTEQRSIVLQLERLMGYPMVRERVGRSELYLHGWHYVIENGQVLVLDIASGQFVALPDERTARSEARGSNEEHS